jgi:hypothetical protein
MKEQLFAQPVATAFKQFLNGLERLQECTTRASIVPVDLELSDDPPLPSDDFPALGNALAGFQKVFFDHAPWAN